MLDKLAKFITRKPLAVFVVALCLVVPAVIGYVNTVVNYDILSYLPAELDSVEGERILDETFNSAFSSMLITENMPAKDTAAIKEKISGIEGVSNVIWVNDIVDLGVPGDFLPDAIKDIFYSSDGDSTMMLIQYDDDGASPITQTAIKQMRSLMNKQCFLSGMSVIMLDTKDLADREAPIYIAIAVAIALAVMSFTMESWVLPFVLLTALGLAVIYNMGTNIIFPGQVSYITHSIAAILQLAVTMDYSVFLIDRYTEEKANFADKRDAMAKAVKSAFLSLAGSSLTTIFGFLALCFMRLTLGRDIGIVMAKGVIFGVVTVIIVLPSMILLCDKLITKSHHRSLVPSFARLNGLLIRHRKVIACAFFLLFIPAWILQNNVEKYYNLTTSLPADMESVIALNKLKDDFNMASTHFIIIDDSTDAGSVTRMIKQLERVEGVSNVIGYNSFLGPAIPDSVIPDSVKAISKQGGKQMIMMNSIYAAATDEANAQIEQVTKIVKSCDPDGILTGEAVLYKDLVAVADYDFKITNIISIAAIFIIVALCFKSISLPVLIVGAIELAIMLNTSVSTVMGTAVSFVSPTIIGCVQLGATVDYAILLITRFREELRSGSERSEAMRIAANASDRSILQSALVFFGATFGVYLFCDIDIIKSICALLARGAVISALVIILLLTPAMLTLEKFIGKTSHNWLGEKAKKKAKIKVAQAANNEAQ